MFVRELSQVSYIRVRAQLAADAAALAAIAESGPTGRNLGPHAARRFAEANGAELVECLCEDGATAMQVEVRIGSIAARARAIYLPDLLRPVSRQPTTKGLHPDLAAAAAALVSAGAERIWVTSGWRSPDEQIVLWTEALRRYGTAEEADDWVARPGTSMHERGLAVDLGGDLSLARRLIAELGLPLVAPLANEPWHFELSYVPHPNP